MAWEWKNRVWNAVATPVRAVVWAPAHAVVDLSKATTGYFKNVQDISMDTLNEIQETISDAWKKGKWYHKLVNMPIAWVGSVAKAFTGWVQATVNPIVNGVFDFAKTWWGFLKNEFNTVASVFSKKLMSDFSFEKLKLTPTRKSRWNPKNLLIGWAAATAVAASSVPEATPVPQVVEQAKPVEDAETKKVIAELKAKSDQQEKNNQELQKSMISMQEEMKKQTQLMQQQLQQKDALITSLQSNDKKQIAQDGMSNQVEEWLDAVSESPKKKEKNLAKENKVSFDPKALDYQAHTLEKDLNTFAGANKYIIETKKATQSSWAQLKISPKNSEYTNYILTIYEPWKVNARVNVDKNESYEWNISLEQATRQWKNNIWTSSLDATSPADHLIKLWFNKI